MQTMFYKTHALTTSRIPWFKTLIDMSKNKWQAFVQKILKKDWKEM